MTEKYLETYEKIEVNPAKRKNVDFETALDSTGFGKYNLLLILVCGMTLFGVNSEAYAVGYVLPSAECDLDLNTYTKGVLSSTNFIGIMGSCCIWGYLSDTKGRKNVLMISLVLAFISSVLAAVIPSFWGFAILRLFNGIFISGPSAVLFAYFGEFHGKSYRSSAMAWVSLFISLALMYLPGLGWILLPRKFHVEFLGMVMNSWRLFMLLSAFPNVIVAVAFTQLPESPKYLYHSGRVEEALAILRKIFAVNSGRSQEEFPVDSLEEKILLVETNKPRMNIVSDLWNQIAPLFMRPHLKYTIAACLMQAGAFAVSSGLYLWYPDIINQLSSADRGNTSATVCEALSMSNSAKNIDVGGCNDELDSQIFIQNIIIGALYLFGYAAWGIIVNFLGNRNFFIVCMGISSVCLLVLNFITQKILIDVLFVVLLTLPGICVAVATLAVVDIIPTYLCGMAVCITMTAGRVGSIASSSMVGMMLQWNCSVSFALYAVSNICCALLALVFPRKPTTIQE